MYKQTSGAFGMVAMLFALITILASVVAIYTYGEITIVEPGRYGLSASTSTVRNWPLIISAVSASFYSLAFVAMFFLCGDHQKRSCQDSQPSWNQRRRAQ